MYVGIDVEFKILPWKQQCSRNPFALLKMEFKIEDNCASIRSHMEGVRTVLIGTANHAFQSGQWRWPLNGKLINKRVYRTQITES